GLTLRGEVSDCIWEMLHAVQSMLGAVGNHSSALQPVGTCWEKCDAIHQVSRDNKQAVTSVLNGQYLVVQDAAEELDETMRTEEEAPAATEHPVPVRNGFNQPRQSTWSPHDRQLLPPGLGLVKAAKTTLRKVTSAVSSGGRCESPEQNADLDRLASLAALSSAHVDDLVMALYPPVFDSAVRDNASELKKHLLSILDATRQDSSEDWVAFLERAVEHNFWNLCNNTQGDS
ncbi:unnamed protein product, partial [Ixodes hexagonus]